MIMHTVKHIPPFTYSYQCGSTLLVSYIPVNMYATFLQIILDVTKGWIIFHSNTNDFPVFMRRFLPHKNLRIPFLISEAMNSWVLLLSFGISSPILSLSLLFSQWVDVSFWLILIGKSVMEIAIPKGSQRNQAYGMCV